MNNGIIDHQFMDTVREIYNRSFQHTLQNLSADPQSHVSEFWVELLATMKPYLMVTPNGLLAIRSRVFNSGPLTDFLFTFSFNFFTQLALNEDEKKRLIATVGGSVSMQLKSHKELSDFHAVPDQISQRLSSESEATDVLGANIWLLMLVLAPVFMTPAGIYPGRKGATHGARSS